MIDVIVMTHCKEYHSQLKWPVILKEIDRFKPVLTKRKVMKSGEKDTMSFSP
jgi:hypothetical protein